MSRETTYVLIALVCSSTSPLGDFCLHMVTATTFMHLPFWQFRIVEIFLKLGIGDNSIEVRVARFFLVQHTKSGKIYQITIHEIYQMATQYTKSP
jgi:hypothetical protein